MIGTDAINREKLARLEGIRSVSPRLVASAVRVMEFTESEAYVVRKSGTNAK
jgi:hypothetical protein